MTFEKPKKKTIDWYGKKVSVPFDCQIYPEKEVEIANRFSGQKTTMPGYAAAVYDTIIGAERFEDWDTVRGLVQEKFCRSIYGGAGLMVIAWNTGLAAERARFNLKLKKKKKKRNKHQASSFKRPGPRKIKYGGRPNNPHAI